jgi:Zn-dependent M28 family amino/carboxypeptidase
MRTGSQVRLVLDSVANKVRSRNIVAQTKTGSRDDVVMVGAHLDSVAGGPGINDNGSGVAAVLETAVQLGAAPQLNNAVRFAFWGGEETGLTGSSGYLYGLDQAALNDMALYLNADMLGSPNAGFFSFIAPEANSAPGESTGVARALADAIRRFGREPVMSATLGRTDIRGFLTAGVPVGSLSTGADELKSNAQQQMWGGTAGQPFDPNYHGIGDTMSNINAEALAVMGRALAYAVGRYAESISGDDGVPGRSERNRPGLGGHR